MTARQGSALDHSLLGHAGPTDIDVAMFHRDAGGGEALGLSRHILNSFGLKEITPCVGCGCVVMSFSWCLAVAPQQAADRRERQQLCRLAQPLPGQIGKGIISPQGAKDRGKNCPGSCRGVPGDMRCSQAVIQDGKRRRELGLLSLEEEEGGAKGTLGLFAAPVWKGVERWSRALLTGACG